MNWGANAGRVEGTHGCRTGAGIVGQETPADIKAGDAAAHLRTMIDGGALDEKGAVPPARVGRPDVAVGLVIGKRSVNGSADFLDARYVHGCATQNSARP